MKQNVKKWLMISGSVIGAVAAGAAVMYLFDPERGVERRASIRQRTWRAGKSLGRSINESIPRHLTEGNFSHLPWAQRFANGATDTINDSVLAQRLRSEVARFAHAANDVDVSVDNGRVYLRGSAPAKIAHKLAKRARAIGGVTGVENHLALRA